MTKLNYKIYSCSEFNVANNSIAGFNLLNKNRYQIMITSSYQLDLIGTQVMSSNNATYIIRAHIVTQIPSIDHPVDSDLKRNLKALNKAISAALKSSVKAVNLRGIEELKEEQQVVFGQSNRLQKLVLDASTCTGVQRMNSSF